jgi:hypothetical protein
LSPSFPCTQISQLVALLIRLMPDTPLIDSKDPSGAVFGQPLWGLVICPAGDRVITVSLVSTSSSNAVVDMPSLWERQRRRADIKSR